MTRKLVHIVRLCKTMLVYHFLVHCCNSPGNSPGAATPCLKKSDLTTCGTTRPWRSRLECLAFVEVLLWISWVILHIQRPTGDHSICLWPFRRKSEVECPWPTDVSSV